MPNNLHKSIASKLQEGVSEKKILDGIRNNFHGDISRHLVTVQDIQNNICDRPRENRPSSHLGMIVEIPILKVVISITSFCSC